jgi:hypothetical protein
MDVTARLLDRRPLLAEARKLWRERCASLLLLLDRKMEIIILIIILRISPDAFLEILSFLRITKKNKINYYSNYYFVMGVL